MDARAPTRDDTADECWMTYAELAAARGISKLLAIRLVHRTAGV
jgi:hypothetical protein